MYTMCDGTYMYTMCDGIYMYTMCGGIYTYTMCDICHGENSPSFQISDLER